MVELVEFELRAEWLMRVLLVGVWACGWVCGGIWRQYDGGKQSKGRGRGERWGQRSALTRIYMHTYA